MNQQFPDFVNKSVAFYIRTPTGAPKWLSEGVVLDSPYFRILNDRVFVMGQTTGSENDTNRSWSDNREAAVAWDSVLYYIVLPTDEYRKYRDTDEAEGVPKVPAAPDPIRALFSIGERPLVSFSFLLICILIPIALLIAIMVWTMKTLAG